MDVNLTKHQRNFHNIIIDWVHERNNLKYGNNYIVCAGYAGTGKTTILSEVLLSLNKMNLKVACATYTGKASQVLAEKIRGRKYEYCGTIHGLIYRPDIDKKSGILLGFIRKKKLEEDIIIIDECSMIDGNLFKDLIKYRKPIIFIGDDAQLPPIGKEKFDIFKKTAVKLTEIHRQSEDSPIIKMSMIIRNGDELKTGLYGISCAKLNWDDERAQKALYEHMPSANNIILCGMNKTRIILNQLIRENLGFKQNFPQKGEKIVCLQNNHSLGIMNGAIGYIKAIQLFKDYAYNTVLNFDCYCLKTNHLVYKEGFNQLKQNDFWDFARQPKIKLDLDNEGFTKLDLMDFGYALSVHKSQGSQWDKVILMTERNYHQSDEDYSRWLYTGITRASEKLLIINGF